MFLTYVLAYHENKFISYTRSLQHFLMPGDMRPIRYSDVYEEDEAAFWAYSLADFTTFRYERFTAALSAAAPNALRLS